MELIRNSASTEVAGDLFWIFTLLLRQSARSSDRDTMATLASAGALSTLEHYRARIGLALADVMAWDEILCSLPVISTETISRTALTQSLFDEMQNQDEEEAEMTRSIREPLLQFSPSMQPSVSLREQETSGVMDGIRNMMSPTPHQRPMPSLPASSSYHASMTTLPLYQSPMYGSPTTSFSVYTSLAVNSPAPSQRSGSSLSSLLPPYRHTANSSMVTLPSYRAPFSSFASPILPSNHFSITSSPLVNLPLAHAPVISSPLASLPFSGAPMTHSSSESLTSHPSPRTASLSLSPTPRIDIQIACSPTNGSARVESHTGQLSPIASSESGRSTSPNSQEPLLAGASHSQRRFLDDSHRPASVVDDPPDSPTLSIASIV
ncbi:hypothetical protein HWV62_1400 [Athelia sp. TMB]|nr:hypothetical protein HWV62_1400 [Athelia sp. TMB]